MELKGIIDNVTPTQGIAVARITEAVACRDWKQKDWISQLRWQEIVFNVIQHMMADTCST